MVGSTVGVVIELLMIVLLVVTISYCFVVNKKLTALRTDQSGLRHVIGELNRSSERAENAISEMRRAALGVEGQIAGQMDAAHQASEDLRQNLERSKELKVIAEKFSDIDLTALKAMERAINPSLISDDQVEISKELKRQRLGFGVDRFSLLPEKKAHAFQGAEPRGALHSEQMTKESA